MSRNLKNVSFVLTLVLLVACGGASQQAEQTNEEPSEPVVATPQIVTSEVSYATESTSLNGYVAAPANAKNAPGELIVHEWWGHNAYTRKRADMLAEMGYVAFAVDMYGDGKQAAHPGDAGKFAGEVFKNLPEANARFTAAMEQLKMQSGVDSTKLAAIGYCFGGSIVLTMANAGYDLDAVAAFHASVDLPVMPGEDLKAQILVANGADDPMVSAESIERFKSAMDASGKPYKYVAYEGAVHAFTNPGADSLGTKFNLALAYNKEADESSWDELKQLFATAF